MWITPTPLCSTSTQRVEITVIASISATALSKQLCCSTSSKEIVILLNFSMISITVVIAILCSPLVGFEPIGSSTLRSVLTLALPRCCLSPASHAPKGSKGWNWILKDVEALSEQVSMIISLLGLTSEIDPNLEYRIFPSPIPGFSFFTSKYNRYELASCYSAGNCSSKHLSDQVEKSCQLVLVQNYCLCYWLGRKLHANLNSFPISLQYTLPWCSELSYY